MGLCKLIGDKMSTSKSEVEQLYQQLMYITVEKETMINCHDLMMEKKPVMAIIANDLEFAKGEFESFWDIYYPVRIDQDMDAEYFQTWNNWLQKEPLPLSSHSCPYCCVSKSCSFCEYGKIQGLCETVDSGYQKAYRFWRDCKIGAKMRKAMKRRVK